MKKTLFILAAALILFSACSDNLVRDGLTVEIREEGGLIRTEVPERAAGQEHMLGFAAPAIENVRIGFIGLGMRGPGAVRRMGFIEGTQVVALCDIEKDRVEYAAGIMEAQGKPAAAQYYGSEDAWMELCDRDDIDLVYIATDWVNHAKMAKYAMEKGKHVAIEVPAAMNMAEIWDLIETSERTRKHCMQLENCVYDFFELTSLNMAQKGLFGEILHAEGAYIHNLEEFWEEYYGDWRLTYNRDHRGDVYPTHGIGPICQALDIHRGDKMNVLVSMDTKSVNGKAYYEKNRGPLENGFANGDQTTTMIRTENGKTMVIQHNVVTPRPYNRLYQLVGTKGFANKYPVQGYMVDPDIIGGDKEASEVIDHENLSAHNCVPAEVKDALMEMYRHPIHQEIAEVARKVGGHGGMDFVMDYRLIHCLRNGLPLDMDVYDLAEWCCLTELTAISIINGNAPVEVPDFTRGHWNDIQGYRHAGINEPAVKVGIAWRSSNLNSSTYKKIAKVVEDAGGVAVPLAQMRVSEWKYDSNGRIDSMYINKDGFLKEEYAEILKSGTYTHTSAGITDTVDLVIFTGGEDISPSLYAVPEPWHGIEEERDYNVTRDISDYIPHADC